MDSISTSITGNIEIVFEEPDNPIQNINDYLECFDITQGATVTIYIDEPEPGSGETWVTGWNGILPTAIVGHTFISITQGDNTSVLGYYPSTDAVTPSNPSDSGVYGNDSGESFSASITKNINSTELELIINYIINNDSTTYNLNSNNCTDFGLAVADLAGLNLPEANDDWPGGSGSNPGTLGEWLNTNSTNSSDNINTTGGNAPLNNKNC